MPMNLAHELKIARCSMDAEDFNDLLLERFKAMFPMWTDEELKNHIGPPAKFVRSIREATQCKELPDYVILAALTNLRKKGRLRPLETEEDE